MIKNPIEKIQAFLEKKERTTLSEIAKACKLYPNTVADIINSMEARGEVVITKIATAKFVEKKKQNQR